MTNSNHWADQSTRTIIEAAAYAAMGTVDCRIKNAPEASRVIADFVLGYLQEAGRLPADEQKR